MGCNVNGLVSDLLSIIEEFVTDLISSSLLAFLKDLFGLDSDGDDDGLLA